MSITPIYSYSRRTGVTKLKVLVKALCVLYDAFKPTIKRWVNDSVSPGGAVVVQGFLDSLSTVCEIIETTPDD